MHAADVGTAGHLCLPRLFQPLLWMPARRLAAVPLEASHAGKLLQCDGLSPTGGSTSSASCSHDSPPAYHLRL